MDKRITPRPQVPAAGLAGVAASLVLAAALVLRPSGAPLGTSAPSSSAASGASVAAAEPTITAGSSLPPGVVAWIDATPAPTPPLSEAPEPSPPPWADLVGHVEVPSVVVAGETLHYLVTLRNNGDQSVPLDPCPAYVERLWSGNTLVAEPGYLLNCAATSAIHPDAITTFEMVLDIPADAPPGMGLLLWGTDGPGPSSQKQPITIAPPGSALGSVPPATVPPTRDELDLADARGVATAYETARAGGDWQGAWLLLSPFSQKKFGSVESFIRGETAYNAQGGSTFVAADPTRSGDLISPEFLGTDLFFDLKGNADIERAWFVGIAHPGVRGASAGSESLIVAPLLDGGAWRVWVR
jgi:hypothetical protein